MAKLPIHLRLMAAKESQSNESRGMCINTFKAATQANSDDFVIAYAYNVSKGVVNKNIENYIFALSKTKQEFYLISLDVNSGNYGSVTNQKTSNLKSVKIDKQGVFILEADEMEKLCFMVPGFTTKNAESMYQLPIVQLDEAEFITNYFKKEIVI